MLERILTSSLAKSFIKCAKSGKLDAHYNKNPLGMIDYENVVFSLWGENFFEDLEESSSYALALLSILRHQSFDTACGLDYLFAQCGSPIEKMFLSALICACNNNEIGIALYSEERHPSFEDLPVHTTSCLHIYPQEQIGNYRVDFLLTLVLENHLIFFEDESHAEITDKSQLVIECDGHDFHEKTKKQASKDKERDRVLQSCGYTIFRFTGSDIYQDAFKCVMESIGHLFDKIIKAASDKPVAEW